MLRLTDQQMKRLDKQADQDLRGRLHMYVRSEMPEHSLGVGDERLQSFIDQAVARAQGHAIRSDGGIAQFVVLAMDAGLDFADDPDISSFLHAPNTDVEDQLELLVDLLDDPREFEEFIPVVAEEGDSKLLAALRSEIDGR